MEVPWFRFWAPPAESTQAILAARTYPEGHWFRGGEGFHAGVDGFEQNGAARLGMIYHSEVAPGSVSIGNSLFASASNLTSEWTDWYDKREKLWRSATYYRDGRDKLAQQMGLKILDAMESSGHNPQLFTVGIGDWQLHGEIGILHLNREAVTGRYPPVDIARLVERHRVEHLAMLQAKDALAHHTEVDRPPFLETRP